MRKNQVKLVAAGMLVLALMTGCGSNDNNADNNNTDNGSSSIISTDKWDAGQNAVEQESPADTGTGQTEESSQSQSQSQSAEAAEGIDEELAVYRVEREKGVSSNGGYTMVELPNEENYDYGVGDSSGYTSRFDSKELNEAFKAARTYVEGTLNLESDVWACIDPRMIAIYEDEDKGVASGYDADNIFLCEYNDNGNWQYLILVREGKGSGWEVLYHGSSYKTD